MTKSVDASNLAAFGSSCDVRFVPAEADSAYNQAIDQLIIQSINQSVSPKLDSARPTSSQTIVAIITKVNKTKHTAEEHINKYIHTNIRIFAAG